MSPLNLAQVLALKQTMAHTAQQVHRLFRVMSLRVLM
jgi:hypothetical protein